ncbi:SNF1-related protein kinase regulatory subunit gamma-like PV42a [Arabidopsis thaliana]|jgi:CBS domain-containing protein|uniref:SNF1-related protein kinase regulatory subunit gamma-like PV42a n=4 Tax=Arabidopsis TaxID=3701 RepID=PV42A_ARATH|nr:Cystathionine beta-synthase (CBS) protein [Arabidopsis thaliana]Q9XI37.1 RecName: Full=SNF1-related protein kinase regulatory subunit gamma-like PV42a; Short=AtPV42a; AltName: Full=AKIN subunit gamma-like PV42a; AltName: Full=CBS domain-containing protein CBSCBS4 [Arabidopsis thaliana]KAG7646410.1 CBS domain [Arabidopsis thaliana x Arabidopsis arenosa]KAG7654388.1 CBS domain [Arabidopsis suecica]AAD39660.1 Similar to gb/U40713 Pv42p gene from Phaseolus vulgaris and contains PF/00571 CBS (cys|eukprot:NP_172985.1 Cystathionine beta-synthase (CBS) protein [Arabidopsis thaliana]
MQEEKSKEDHSRLINVTAKDLTVRNRRLVEVPYTATLSHAMNTLVANSISALPVAAPPGHWIGAGGSMIMESDKQTGVVRKHYIGILTMLDILAHIAGEDSNLSDLDRKMSSQVSSIIGHCLEGLSLWTLNPNTSVLECMEVFSKGIHRALVPVESSIESNNTIAGVELIESASAYKMLTQMDLLRFLKDHHFDDLKTVLSRSISDLGAVNDSVYAITERTTVSNAINVMKGALLNAVPIVHAPDIAQEDHLQLVNGRHRKVIGTFSATDLKGCRLPELQTWLPLTALEFTEKTSGKEREVVSCGVESTMEEAIEKVVTRGVHRVWVMDQQGLLQGVVSLTDIIRSLRSTLS